MHRLWPVFIMLFLSGCAGLAAQAEQHQRDDVAAANIRLRAIVSQECDMAKMAPPPGFEVPGPGYQNTNYRVRCVAGDGSVKVLWFGSMGNLESMTTFKE